MTPGRIRVLQLVDTLDAGGMERVAVNIANCLPGDRFESALCTTRRDGALSAAVASNVSQFRLDRRSRFDLAAVKRLAALITSHDIHIVHAHSSSLFIAVIGSWIRPRTAVLWHDHYGGYNAVPRPLGLYRWATRRVSGVVAVSEALATWARRSLPVPDDRVWYIPNFVVEAEPSVVQGRLPGAPGCRIVCVGNLRPAKNHPDLLRALTAVRTQYPEVHLLLVGTKADELQVREITKLIDELGLGPNVTLMGYRSDVTAILQQCDVGVLSSVVEGFPLALAEYGMAGLPVVATAVGQCPEVLDDGRAGLLTPARDPASMASAISSLLGSSELRARLGRRLRARVQERFSRKSVVGRLCGVYETVRPSAPPNAA